MSDTIITGAAGLFGEDMMAERIDDPGACFISTLERVSHGEAAERAELHMRDASRAVIQTGKKATVLVKLELKPNGSRGVEVMADISSKVPQADMGKSFFFADGEGRLSRSPPPAESGELMKQED